MTRCPVCQTSLQGPNNYCSSCGISRPGAAQAHVPEDDRADRTSKQAGFAQAGAAAVPTAGRLPPLLLCVVMDLLGMATYASPFLGEIADVAWAPISGFVFYLLFRRAPGVSGTLGAILATAEEALPITDVIPTFTIAWFVAYFAKRRTGLGAG